MVSARDRMKRVHQQGGNTNSGVVPPVKVERTAPPKTVQQAKEEAAATVIEEETIVKEVEPEKVESLDIQKEYKEALDEYEAQIVLRPKKHVVVEGRKIPKKVALFAREEGIVNGSYGSKRLQTSFDCANKEVHQWAKNFTTENQFNGGCSITKSDLIEICLDTFFYDLGLEPIGYESYAEMREDIWRKMKDFKGK